MANLTASTPVKELPTFIDFKSLLGEEPTIKSKKDFISAIERIPVDKESMIPDDVASWYESQTSGELPPDKPKASANGSKRKKWNGEGTPFRVGSKYLEVFEILKAGTHTRGELSTLFTEKYGEKTGNSGNVSTYIGNTMKVVSDYFKLVRGEDGREKLEAI